MSFYFTLKTDFSNIIALSETSENVSFDFMIGSHEVCIHKIYFKFLIFCNMQYIATSPNTKYLRVNKKIIKRSKKECFM